jgi:hypothetical protein
MWQFLLFRAPAVLALMLVTGVHAKQAVACSSNVVVIGASYPKPGAVDVPTNAVAFVYGPQLTSSDVELVDDAGNVVPTEARVVQPSGIDLVPLDELAPNHTYQLRSVGTIEPAAVEFTTGAGPAESPEVLDSPGLELVLLDHSMGTCGKVTGLCVNAPPSPNTTLEIRVGEEVLRDGVDAARPLYRAYVAPVASDECITARFRDVRGNCSESAQVCGEDLHRMQLPDSSGEPSGYTCDEYLTTAETQAPTVACSFSPAPPTRPRLLLLLLATAALLVVRRGHHRSSH